MSRQDWVVRRRALPQLERLQVMERDDGTVYNHLDGPEVPREATQKHGLRQISL